MVLSGGEGCTTGPGGYVPSTTKTILDPDNTVNEAGTITTFCIYDDNSSAGSFSIKCKIFRINSLNYDVIHTHSSWQTHNGSGAQNFTVSWDVIAGDILGVAIAGSGSYIAGIELGADGTGNYKDYSGDVTSSTVISNWYSETYPPKMSISGEIITGDKYVDIATGSDSDSGNTWVSAYLTVKKGIDNVAISKKIHIAEGNYSAQATIDLDKNLELVCEDYGGGNASPPLTVTLPPTA